MLVFRTGGATIDRFNVSGFWRDSNVAFNFK